MPIAFNAISYIWILLDSCRCLFYKVFDMASEIIPTAVMRSSALWAGKII